MAATPKQNPGASRGGIAKVYAEWSNVIASAAKQSIRQQESKSGLLRCARNDGSGLFEI